MAKENWRLGHKVRTFGGVRQDCDPGALPPWLFRNLINVRFSGGGITERGGQSKINGDDQLEGCVTGIIPGDALPSQFTETLYVLSATGELNDWTPTGGLGTPSGAGDWVNLQGTAGNDSEGAEESITISSNTLVGIDLQWATGPAGNDPPVVSTIGAASQACSGGMAKQSGVWYQGLTRTEGGIEKFQVYINPSVALDREYVGAPGGDSTTRVWLAVYEETGELLAALEPGALHRKSAAGVWSRVSLPAGCTINRNHLANWAELGGVFYFTGFGPGGGHLLYSYDGTLIAPLHSWAGSPGTYSPLEIHDGDLYFGINAGGVIQVGRYDGTSFSVVATLSGATEIRELVSAFSRLFALRGNTLESSVAPESAPWVVDDSTAGAFQAGALRRVR